MWVCAVDRLMTQVLRKRAARTRSIRRPVWMVLHQYQSLVPHRYVDQMLRRRQLRPRRTPRRLAPEMGAGAVGEGEAVVGMVRRARQTDRRRV